MEFRLPIKIMVMEGMLNLIEVQCYCKIGLSKECGYSECKAHTGGSGAVHQAGRAQRSSNLFCWVTKSKDKEFYLFGL